MNPFRWLRRLRRQRYYLSVEVENPRMYPVLSLRLFGWVAFVHDPRKTAWMREDNRDRFVCLTYHPSEERATSATR